MPDGLSASDVAGEISKHRQHQAEHHDGKGEGSDSSDDDDDHGPRGHDRTLSIVEAILLAIVALLAAYTGFALGEMVDQVGCRTGRRLGRPDRSQPGFTASSRHARTSTRPRSTPGFRPTWPAMRMRRR